MTSAVLLQVGSDVTPTVIDVIAGHKWPLFAGVVLGSDTGGVFSTTTASWRDSPSGNRGILNAERP